MEAVENWTIFKIQSGKQLPHCASVLVARTTHENKIDIHKLRSTLKHLQLQQQVAVLYGFGIKSHFVLFVMSQLIQFVFHKFIIWINSSLRCENESGLLLICFIALLIATAAIIYISY